MTASSSHDLYAIAAEEAARYHARGLPSFERDDLIQEAALKLWKLALRNKVDAGRTPKEQRAYLGKSARHAITNYLLWRSRWLVEIPYGDTPTQEDANTPEAVAAGLETQRALCRAVEEATSRMSAAELAVVECRLGFRPLPDSLQVAAKSTVATHAARARRKVQERLRVHGRVDLVDKVETLFSGM